MVGGHQQGQGMGQITDDKLGQQEARRDAQHKDGPAQLLLAPFQVVHLCRSNSFTPTSKPKQTGTLLQNEHEHERDQTATDGRRLAYCAVTLKCLMPGTFSPTQNDNMCLSRIRQLALTAIAKGKLHICTDDTHRQLLIAFKQGQYSSLWSALVIRTFAHRPFVKQTIHLI